MIEHDELLKVSNNMFNYGGSFVRALGEALAKADAINQQKIKDAFPEYWEQYLNWGKS